jgi:hypothetical protein
MEKISWTDRVRNEVLHRVKKEKNIIHTIKRRKANWIGHILHKDCLLKELIEGKQGEIGVTGRQEKDVCSYFMTLREKKHTGN